MNSDGSIKCVVPPRGPAAGTVGHLGAGDRRGQGRSAGMRRRDAGGDDAAAALG